MATYEDAIQAAQETYSEYRNLLNEIDRRKELYGENAEMMESFRAIEQDAEYMSSMILGQVKLISKMYGKKYFPVLNDLKDLHDENL